jgi:hypothetical protein
MLRKDSGTGHIIWNKMTKLVHDLAQRERFVAAVLSLGVLLPQTYILLGDKSRTMRWAEHVARFRGIRIIIEKPTW